MVDGRIETTWWALRIALGATAFLAGLVAITCNLVTTGVFFDLAVRDLVMAVAAFGLARITCV